MPNPTKPLCKYGKECYRIKNKSHLENYGHPHVDIDQKRAITPTPEKNDGRETKRARQFSSDSSGSSGSGSSSPTKNEYNLRSPRSSTGSSANDTSDVPPAAKVTKVVPISKYSRSSHEHSSSQNYCNDGPTPDKDIDFINDIFDKETMFSQRAEYKQMLKDPQVFIKHKFLVEMPKDFYSFWEYCQANAKKDTKPEQIFSKFGLTLLGPFDVLAGHFDEAQMYEPGDYLRHCRYYYDPPEFQVRNFVNVYTL